VADPVVSQFEILSAATVSKLLDFCIAPRGIFHKDLHANIDTISADKNLRASNHTSFCLMI